MKLYYIQASVHWIGKNINNEIFLFTLFVVLFLLFHPSAGNNFEFIGPFAVML